MNLGPLPGLGDFGVRPMRAEDLPLVLEVEQASYTNPWHISIFERELENRCARLDLLCRQDDPKRLVGHMIYWVVHDELHLLNIAVHPGHRRQGLARAMMGRLLQICQEQRLQYVALEVRASNEAAIALYKDTGFQKIGLRKRYYSDNGEDAIVMALVLEEA